MVCSAIYMLTDKEEQVEAQESKNQRKKRFFLFFCAELFAAHSVHGPQILLLFFTRSRYAFVFVSDCMRALTIADNQQQNPRIILLIIISLCLRAIFFFFFFQRLVLYKLYVLQYFFSLIYTMNVRAGRETGRYGYTDLYYTCSAHCARCFLLSAACFFFRFALLHHLCFGLLVAIISFCSFLIVSLYSLIIK